MRFVSENRSKIAAAAVECLFMHAESDSGSRGQKQSDIGARGKAIGVNMRVRRGSENIRRGKAVTVLTVTVDADVTVAVGRAVLTALTAASPIISCSISRISCINIIIIERR